MDVVARTSAAKPASSNTPKVTAALRRGAGASRRSAKAGQPIAHSTLSGRAKTATIDAIALHNAVVMLGARAKRTVANATAVLASADSMVSMPVPA